MYLGCSQLAKELSAPNGDEDELLDALDVAQGQCGTDDCWERRSHEVQLAREAALQRKQSATVGLAGGVGSGNASECQRMAQLTTGTWLDGPTTTFAFTDDEKTRGAGAVGLKILAGCANCAFSRGVGSLGSDGVLRLLAFGKGDNLTHIGTMTSDSEGGGGCRIEWSSAGKAHKWADFCQGKPCSGRGPPKPPGPPHRQSGACKKMLSEGFWQPYCAAGSPPGTCTQLANNWDW